MLNNYLTKDLISPKIPHGYIIELCENFNYPNSAHNLCMTKNELVLLKYHLTVTDISYRTKGYLRKLLSTAFA